MTEAEELKKGILTVDVDYIAMAQAVNNAIHMLQKFKDKLDIAAIERKGVDREEQKRNGS